MGRRNVLGRTPKYELALHVHACRVEEHVILLDIKRDQYLGLSAPLAIALTFEVHGWPPDNPTSAVKPHERMDDAVLNTIEWLKNEGVVIESPIKPVPRVPICIPRPAFGLFENCKNAPANVRFSSLVNVLATSIQVSLCLRCLSLERTLFRLQRHRLNVAPTKDHPTPEEQDQLRTHVVAFRALRPLAIAARSPCLFESLALGEFLASQGLFPRIVFGVDANPFAAHCWLQWDDVVINDSPEYVSRFTPIMVI